MLKDKKLFYIIIASLSVVIFGGSSLLILNRAGVQTGQIGIPTSTGTVRPVNPATSGLYNYPDNLLDIEPKTPVSPKYIVEHRSVLNGKTITVQGIVVSALLGDAACAAGRGACAKPRIILAETMEDGRDKNYDLIVYVDEEDSNYAVEQTVLLTVNVFGNKNGVNAAIVYNE